MIDDAAGDLQVVLPEGPRWIVDRRAAEPLDDAGRTETGREARSKDGVAPAGLGVVPETVQGISQPLADAVEAGREGLGGLAVAHHHHLRRARTSLHHHLEITGETLVRALRIGAQPRFHQGAAHRAGDFVHERMMHGTTWDVHHAMRAFQEQADLRRTHPTPDGQPCAVPESLHCALDEGNGRQAVPARKGVRGAPARSVRGARLAEPGTGGTRRTVRAGDGQHARGGNSQRRSDLQCSGRWREAASGAALDRSGKYRRTKLAPVDATIASHCVERIVERMNDKALFFAATDRQPALIPVSVSAHHVHLSPASIVRLFGPHHVLHPRNDVRQPDQFASA